MGALLGLIVIFTPHAWAQTDTATTTSDAEALSTSTPSITIPFDPFDPTQVEAKVRQDFADIPVMIKIAKCESDFTQYDSTGHPMYGGTGGMVGVFQVAAAVHTEAAQNLSFDINTLDGNLAYARYLYENEGTGPWLASSRCWNPSAPTVVLKVGSFGKQVKAMQEILNRSGYTIAKQGEGSPGQESGVFGPRTKDALKRFQCDAHIVCSGSEKTSGYGMVGQKTRVALLLLDAKHAQALSTTNLSKK